MWRRAGGLFLGLLLCVPGLPAAGESGTFGTLLVNGDGWDMVPMQAPANYSQDLFQVIGDHDGDGFDDLLLWQRGYPGRSVARGNSTGFGGIYGISGGVCIPESCGPTTDAGQFPGEDLRPISVDLDGDGRSEIPLDMRAVCTPGPCTDAFTVFSNNGLRDRSFSVPSSLTGQAVAAYVVGPLWNGTDGALVTEELAPRTANGTGPAVTTFRAIGFKGMVAESTVFTWTLSEPVPLSLTPRPPRFMAAPDFDGDGLADIVTWVPPAPGANGTNVGQLHIYNGSTLREPSNTPIIMPLRTPDVLIADFSGDGHPDIATYQTMNVRDGRPVEPYVSVSVVRWRPGPNPLHQPETVELSGPSVFISQPPPRLQAGDIDGDGLADLVVAKYDTTSAMAGHVLVDVFLAPFFCFDTLDCDFPVLAPVYSGEITLSGDDIYSGANGLRLNLQGDFDGDGRRDLVVGYYGGNAPERGRTSTSGFVAVMHSTVLIRKIFPLWIETDPGGEVHPQYRNYTLHLDHWRAALDTPTMRINFTGLSPALHIDLEQTGSLATSSDPSLLAIDGAPVFGHNDESDGRYWTAAIPIRFAWGLPANVWFGLDARFVNSSVNEFAQTSRAAKFSPDVEIIGDPLGEYDGRIAGVDGWARAGVPLNVSNISLAFAGPGAIAVPSSEFLWDISSPYTGPRFVRINPFVDTWSTPSVTTLNASYHISVLGAPSSYLRETRAFNLSFDGDIPTFGEHLPLDSDWASVSPTLVAVEVIDEASGPDYGAVEFAWQPPGGSLGSWSSAEVFPGERPQEAVARVMIGFPEGAGSEVVWRVWDMVGNGPSTSENFTVNVDRTNLSFHDPSPSASEWAQNGTLSARIWISPGPSGLNSSTVQYRLSTNGLFDFGPWAPYCVPPAPPQGGCLRQFRLFPNGSVDLASGYGYNTPALNLSEGDGNWIQWRAASNASAELRNSDPYQMRVDSISPVFAWLRPNGTEIVPLSLIRVGAGLRDGNDPSVAQQGINTSAGSTTFRVRAEGQANFSSPLPLRLESSTRDAYTANFEDSFALPRGNLTIEISATENGGRTVSAETNIRINQLPTLKITSNPPGLVVVVNGTIMVAANVSDPDGQPLSIRWTLCGPREEPFSRSDSVAFSQYTAVPASTTTIRTFEVCVAVSDGLDGVITQRFNITVTATPPPQDPPNVAGVGIDASAIAIIFVAAFAALIGALFIRKRRRPPPANL